MYYEKNLKRMSSFYVNEVHLITMLLPYIEGKIKKDCKIHTILQNNLDKTVNVLLERLNLKDEVKLKIKSIDWKIKTVEEYIDKEKNINDKSINYILINGDSKFISKANNVLEELNTNKEDRKLVIINCYDIIEFNKNIIDILNYTDKILNTSGEHEIEEIFPEYVKEKKKA